MNDFAKSMKLVISSLTYPKSQKQILDETRLSPRTFRFAVSRLKNMKLIEEFVSLKDIRMKFCRRSDKNE